MGLLLVKEEKPLYEVLPMFEKEESKNSKGKRINENALVRQDNRLINGRWRMNINQSRIFLTGVSMIQETDEENQTYFIDQHQLKTLIDRKGNSLYEELRKDVPKLMSKVIEIERPDGKKDWIQIGSASYVDGELRLRFSKEIRPYLIGLKEQFTQFKLSEAIRFKSSYTLRIFMLLKQFDKKGWRWIDLEDLRNTLDLNKTPQNQLKKDLYVKINDLKKRVIEPSIAEMKEAGFKVSYEEIKESRKIVAFKFSWRGSMDVEVVEFNPKNEQAERLLYRMRAIGLHDPQIKHISSMVGKGITNQELQQTVWAIEKAIRERNIPKEKAGGYARKTFIGKFGISGL